MTPKKLNSKTWNTLDKNNEYFQFIQDSANKKYPQGTKTHLHHVIPLYVFGKNASKEAQAFMNSPQNIIILSVEDHVKAHELLYKIYKNKQDKGASLRSPVGLRTAVMLNGYEQESRLIWRTLGAKAVNQLMKEQKKTFWDPEFQVTMAARSMAREDAIEIRSKAGQIGGTNRQAGRAIKTGDRYLFDYDNQAVLCIINCNSGTQVLEELNKYKKTPLQRVSPLLNGSKASLHKWSCKRVV
jgi:hypothetical protein